MSGQLEAGFWAIPSFVHDSFIDVFAFFGFIGVWWTFIDKLGSTLSLLGGIYGVYLKDQLGPLA